MSLNWVDVDIANQYQLDNTPPGNPGGDGDGEE